MVSDMFSGTWFAMCVSIGIIVGLLICIIIIKFTNKDGKSKTQYDEMQELERGKAYKYAFWTMCGVAAFIGCLTLFEIKIPFDMFTLFLMVILSGTVVQASYCIMKDAYIGLNTNKVKTGIALVVIGIINLINVILFIVKGKFFVDGMFNLSFCNLLCGLTMLFIGVMFVIKNAVSKKEDSGDEES